MAHPSPGTGPTSFARRFARNRLAVAGAVVALALFAVGALAPWITPYDPLEQNLANVYAPPSSRHVLGTDGLGRDLLSGLVSGTRAAMIVGVGTLCGSLLVGITLGATAGFAGGVTDTVINRVMDVVLAFPFLIGALLIVRVAAQLGGTGIVTVIVALTLLSWVTPARLMRGQVMALRDAPHVEAARSIGAGTLRIVVRHVLPLTVGPAVAYSFTSVGYAIVGMTTLSFLGIGVSPDAPDWGQLIAVAGTQLVVPERAYLWLAPSAALGVTIIAFTFVADGLRDALDPTTTYRS